MGFSRSVVIFPVRHVSAISIVVRGGTLRWDLGGSGHGIPLVTVQPLGEGPSGVPSKVHSTAVGGATCSHTVAQRRVRSDVRCLLRSTAEGQADGTRDNRASCTFVSGDIGSLPGLGVHQTIGTSPFVSVLLRVMLLMRYV